MDEVEVRLRIVELAIPQATKISMERSEILLKTCEDLEKYVLKSKPSKGKSASTPKKAPAKPRK